VKHSTDSALTVPADDLDTILYRFSRMNHEREPHLTGQNDLGGKGLFLLFLRGELIVIIKTRFTDRHYTRVLSHTSEVFHDTITESARFMRVETNGGIDVRIGFGLIDCFPARIRFYSD